LLRSIFFICLVLSALGNVTCFGAGITAKSWIVSDTEGQILKSENPDFIRSIASISKLLVVMTVLDAHQNLSETVPLSTKLRDALPKQLSRKILIDLALVNSNNRAAQTLCEQYPGGFGVCIYAMNQKLTQLGMIESIVYEPTGLDKRNMSTARDLVRLVVEAKKYPEIIEAAQKSKVEINSNKKKIIYNNTNPMVGKENILVSKTGWISASGGCIVLLMNNKIIILLGSRNTHTRIPEAKYLAA